MAPVQAVMATITPEADDYAREVAAALRARGLRVELDLRNEKIPYKVREHSLAKVPLLIALGKREISEQTISLRRLGSQATQTMPLAEMLEGLTIEAQPPHPDGPDASEFDQSEFDIAI